MNNFDFKKSVISSKEELEKIKNRIREISEMREMLSTKEEKAIYDIENRDELAELYELIRRGIPVSNIPYKKEITLELVSFFNNYGISEEQTISHINELEFFVSDIVLGHGAELVYTCNRIGINSTYVEFLEDGTITYKPEYKDFLIHTIRHEMLHKLSSEEAGKSFPCGEDALIEGYTEMFNHYISGKSDINNILYEFPERVCRLFTEMIGIEETVDDYIYNNKSHPNLQRLFETYGADFSFFRISLSNILVQISKEKNMGIDGCLALEQKIACLDFISNNILVPYCQQNLGEQTRLIERFNSLFSEFDYNLSVEEINKDNKKI